MKSFFVKKYIFFLLFIFLFCCGWFYLQFTKKNTASGSNKIKTPCRLASLPEGKQYQTERIKKLEKLMSSSIDWIIKDTKGNVIDLYCFRGKKTVVINFWASWCPPCIKELPSLSRLAENNPDQLFVLAISEEPLLVIKKFIQQSFSDLSSNLKIAQVSKEDKLRYFPEDQLPATYVFDKEGILKIKELGARDWSEKRLVQYILNL